MKKVPTLFARDPENRKYVTREINPAAQWVIDGEGEATRKYDGTCVMLDENHHWWARREVKKGKTPPPGYQPIETDEATGKTVGWEPIEQSPFAKYLHQAIEALPHTDYTKVAYYKWLKTTYELIGPKINGNPEGATEHKLIPHPFAETLDAPRDYEALAEWLHNHPYEGIVWHHPDGRMAKIKKKDFPAATQQH